VIRAGLEGVVVVTVLAGIAYADSDAETDAARAFRDAEAHAAAGDAHAIDELEALGAVRPLTRWTDDAWTEAGRLAERAGDLERARRDDQQALAVTTDDQLARRLQAALARIASSAGDAGQWAKVAADHVRLESLVQASVDPTPALRELGALVDANPRYPRAARAMVAIAHGWQRDGNLDQARAWLERACAVANPEDRPHVVAELVRVLVARGDFAEARANIDELTQPALVRELDALYARAKLRHDLRGAAWGVLAALLLAAAIAARRACGSWRASWRAVARPPIEAIFMAPIALVIALVAATGNPLVAHAVRIIVIAGVVVTWLSGAILERARARTRVSWRRAVVHAALAVLAALAATYLAIERDRTIDLVVETWRSGPQR
jgi:Tfp pilus assembly protein PilF